MLDLTKISHATIYIVGGYVRDRLLGLSPSDHDFVVCGATHDDMIAAGFIPIEATSFPVYHHPLTRDEFALARTEKKVGNGYHGFECFCDPTISIKTDLYRRDLTINAMAREVIEWNDKGHAHLSDTIIDPFGGRDDLTNKIIRHVSEHFKDDPVRVLRAARFAARYDSVIAEDTLSMIDDVILSNELAHVTKERIWLEIQKAIDDGNPDMFFDMLDSCGASSVLFPELETQAGEVFKKLTGSKLSTEEKITILFAAIGKPHNIHRLWSRFPVPKDIQRNATVMSHIYHRQWNMESAEDIHALMNITDLYRRSHDIPIIFHLLRNSVNVHQMSARLDALEAVMSGAGTISFSDLSASEKESLRGRDIGVAISAKRITKIQDLLLLDK